MATDTTSRPSAATTAPTGASTAATAAKSSPEGHAHVGIGIGKYSRKVFIGGLPPDIDQKMLADAFGRFGALDVDWPHRSEQSGARPPKGYCFLLFGAEESVHALLANCVLDDAKYYYCVSSGSADYKPVQVRAWLLADAEWTLDARVRFDWRCTVFVGGVPRPLRAQELANLFNELFGGVRSAAIDTDAQFNYPKGAARVTFATRDHYCAAIKDRFVHIRLRDMDKRVEVEPYVQSEQKCDTCAAADGNYFCASLACLRYYCATCWWLLHAAGSARELHKPLVKSGSDRPRPAQPPRAAAAARPSPSPSSSYGRARAQ